MRLNTQRTVGHEKQTARHRHRPETQRSLRLSTSPLPSLLRFTKSTLRILRHAWWTTWPPSGWHGQSPTLMKRRSRSPGSPATISTDTLAHPRRYHSGRLTARRSDNLPEVASPRPRRTLGLRQQQHHISVPSTTSKPAPRRHTHRPAPIDLVDDPHHINGGPRRACATDCRHDRRRRVSVGVRNGLDLHVF